MLKTIHDSFMVEPETSGDYYNRFLTVPNLITSFGILVGCFNFSLIYIGWAIIFWISIICLAGDVVMGITDLADGRVARKLKQRSKWGELLDPARDGMIVGNLLCHYGSFVGFSTLNHPFIWVTVAFECLIGAGGWIIGLSYKVSSHAVGKLRRAAQTGIFFFLVVLETFGINTKGSLILLSIVALSSVFAFVSYMHVNRQRILPAMFEFMALLSQSLRA